MTEQKITPEIVQEVAGCFGYVTHRQGSDIATALNIYSLNEGMTVEAAVGYVLEGDESDEMVEGHHA